jgi:hypothetical protein
MAIRKSPESNYERSVKGAVRLYLDDIEHVVDMLAATDGNTTIALGPDGSRVADELTDIADATPNDRRCIRITRSTTGRPFDRVSVTLHKNYIKVWSYNSAADVRVLIDDIAQFIESRRGFRRYGLMLAWAVPTAMAGFAVLAYDYSLMLAGLAVLAYAASIIYLWEVPKGAVIDLRRRADVMHLSHQTKRALWVGTATAFPAMLAGFGLAYLFLRP